jgi:hypothetical protein
MLLLRSLRRARQHLSNPMVKPLHSAGDVEVDADGAAP